MLCKYKMMENMKNNLKKSAIALAFLLLPACTNMHIDPSFGKPSSLDTTPPAGTKEYQQGWSDGCETGIAGYGNSFYKMFHSVRKNASYIGNPTYDQVWRDAYNYCRVQMKTAQLQGFGNYGEGFGIEAIIRIPKILDS